MQRGFVSDSRSGKSLDSRIKPLTLQTSSLGADASLMLSVTTGIPAISKTRV